MKLNFSFRVIILLLISVNLLEKEKNKRGFPPDIQPYSVTIIGEQHQHPESIKLFQSLIKGYLKNNSCLTVALEIESNQQPVIKQIMQGRAVASDLKISSIIDQPALRELINDLAKLKLRSACLNLIGIDSLKENRDELMVAQLMKNIGATPILALLGGLHSLKKVNWDLSMTKGHSYVAEILNKQRINVRSYPQIWVDSECSDNEQLDFRFVSNQSNEALTLLNNHFISMMNAHVFSNASKAIDGVILWECTNNLG
ncbi:hypothetical protein [uncultured Gammaproteobacteria bacterium]|nr:hypothetical protein [uncultured Gammaproteobacteria bacterium]